LARKAVDCHVMGLYHSARQFKKLPFFIPLLAMFELFCPKQPFACVHLHLTAISIFSLPHGNNCFFFCLHSNLRLTAISIFSLPHGGKRFFLLPTRQFTPHGSISFGLAAMPNGNILSGLVAAPHGIFFLPQSDD
jgi:hypothetical protein